MPTFHFTQHALDRFIQRVRPDVQTHAAALEMLTEAAESAVRLNLRSRRQGHELWLVGSPRCVLVVKHDRKDWIVSTILERDDVVDRHEELVTEQAAQDDSILPVWESRDTSKTEVKQLIHLAQVRSANLREMEKTKRHEINVTQDQARAALRLAMTYILGVSGEGYYEANRYWKKIEAINPHFVSDKFLKGGS